MYNNYSSQLRAVEPNNPMLQGIQTREWVPNAGQISEIYSELGAAQARGAMADYIADGGYGPFPYARDGTVFRNSPQILPSASPNYYREYTIPTPSMTGRDGLQRLIVGQRGKVYHTPSHYVSAYRIR